jgi:hypothetical protein
VTYTKTQYTTNCRWCNEEVSSTDSRIRYCSTKCKNNYGSKQYHERNKLNRNYYFKRLLSSKNRRAITISMLEEIYQKQHGLCALSQTPMTWEIEKGRVLTNISIDRIFAGGPYEIQNIRLVCDIVNSMRNTLSDEELIGWCGRIYNH